MTIFSRIIAGELPSYKVAEAIKEAIPCKKVGMAVLGLEVPHAHIHLVPLKGEGDMDFKNKIENPSPEKMKEVCELIASRFKA